MRLSETTLAIKISPLHRGSKFASGICLLFFIKAIILGFWIIPLWDIPDEIGHFAYAREIVREGRVLPLGKAIINTDIYANLYNKPKREVKPKLNHIAQHPPLYHVIAGLLWKVAKCFTNKQELLFRFPRLASALFGALTLFIIYKLIGQFHVGEKTSLAVMVAFSSIPMFSWLSSGINHDVLVALLGVSSTYYLVLFFKNRKIKNAYLSVFFMSLAALTKMTCLVVLAPLVGLYIVEMRGSPIKCMKKIFLLILIGFFLPGLWLIRNLLEYGNPLATALSILPEWRPPTKDLSVPFIEFLKNQPIIEQLYLNFIGLMGGIGKSAGQSKMFQILPPFLTVYVTIGIVLCLTSLLWYFKVLYSAPYNSSDCKNLSLIEIVPQRTKKITKYWLILFAFLALCSLFFTHYFIRYSSASFLIVPLFSIITACCLLANAVFFLPIPPAKRHFFYSALIFAFFSCILLAQIHSLFQGYGRLRAVHGRYFYPLLGMLVLAFIIPGLLFMGRLAERLALPVAIVVCVNEAAFYFLKVLPYAQG